MAKRPLLPVILAPRFLTELKHQTAYLAERNPQAALAAESRVRVALRRLGRFPEMGRQGRIRGTRELSIYKTRFIIAYRTTGEAVEVAALLHSSQQWPTNL